MIDLVADPFPTPDDGGPLFPTDPEAPCKKALTRACFEEYPEWAKIVLAIRLLFLLFPPGLSRYLFTMLGLFPFNADLNLPPWLFQYPPGFYPPDTVFPGDPSPFPPTPPGVPYPFPPPPGPEPPVDGPPGEPEPPVAGPPVPPGTPPPGIPFPPVPPPTYPPDIPVPPPDTEWKPPEPPEPPPKPLAPIRPILRPVPPFLWPPPFGPPRAPGFISFDVADPSLLYYEPFQGPQLCTQLSYRWKFNNYYPDSTEECPNLPFYETYNLEYAPTTNIIDIKYLKPNLKWVVTSGGAAWDLDEPVDCFMYDRSIDAYHIPFEGFRLKFSASITDDSYGYGSNLWLVIRRKSPAVFVHFALAFATNYGWAFPDNTSSRFYVDWSDQSGIEQQVDLRNYWPGNGYEIQGLNIRADIGAGAVCNLSLEYFDLWAREL